MVVSVQFKNRDKQFVGKTYDYELCEDERVPTKGDIIRMLDENYDLMCYGTRVKVVDVKRSSDRVQTKIRYMEASMDE